MVQDSTVNPHPGRDWGWHAVLVEAHTCSSSMQLGAVPFRQGSWQEGIPVHSSTTAAGCQHDRQTEHWSVVATGPCSYLRYSHTAAPAHCLFHPPLGAPAPGHPCLWAAVLAQHPPPTAHRESHRTVLAVIKKAASPVRRRPHSLRTPVTRHCSSSRCSLWPGRPTVMSLSCSSSCWAETLAA